MSDTGTRDYSISLIRLIATIFIVACHFMQYFNSPLTWWFNVGVQMFLFMSGFLYGKKKSIEDDFLFVRRQFRKILVDYYLVIIPVIIALFLFSRENISYTKAFEALLTYGTISGGKHLWYIPYCLLTYLFTPFLIRFFDRIGDKNIVLKTIVLLIVTQLLTETFLNYFNSSLVVCYVIGFFFGRISEDENRKTTYQVASIFFIFVAVIFNSILILQDNVFKIGLPGFFGFLYTRFRDYAHVTLGIALFLIFKAVFNRIFRSGYPRAVQTISNTSDKLSYDVYLVHQIIILGPFSLMALTQSATINVLIILAIIVVSAVLVHWISSKIQSKLERI